MYYTLIIVIRKDFFINLISNLINDRDDDMN